jgi:hypothetical protein
VLALDSPKWSQLHHAYGVAADVPDMLRQLETFPPYETYESQPYFMLWSSLCHQGDVYPASYAAVPHIIRILASAPVRAHWDFLLLPAAIEIARATGRGPEIASDLRDDYLAALRRIPALAASASEAPWDELYCRAVASAIAVAKGQPRLGEAILELEPDAVKEFMEARFR